MPVSTFEYLIQQHQFFGHFKHLVISGAILLVKPEPAIYKHLVEQTGIVPAESVFIDDLLEERGRRARVRLPRHPVPRPGELPRAAARLSTRAISP